MRTRKSNHQQQEESKSQEIDKPDRNPQSLSPKRINQDHEKESNVAEGQKYTDQLPVQKKSKEKLKADQMLDSSVLDNIESCNEVVQHKTEICLSQIELMRSHIEKLVCQIEFETKQKSWLCSSFSLSSVQKNLTLLEKIGKDLSAQMNDAKAIVQKSFFNEV